VKKIVLLALFNLGALSTYAQRTFGILAGFSNATQHVSGVNNIINRKYFLLWHAGVVADIPLAGRFYLQPQLLASAKGSRVEANDLDSNVYSSSSISNKVRMIYLELPVNILYKHALGPGKLIAGAGPYIAYGLGGKSKTTYTSRYSGITNTMEYTVKFKNETHPGSDAFNKYSYYKPLDAGLNFIAGYELNNGLCFNVNYSLGLTDTAPSDGTLPDGTTITYNSTKNSYFGLTVGYLLRKHK
jgi:hypothetical protein